jgi:hypothetical protein
MVLFVYWKKSTIAPNGWGIDHGDDMRVRNKVLSQNSSLSYLIVLLATFIGHERNQ